MQPGEAPRPAGEYAVLAAADLDLEPSPARWCVVPTPQGRLKLWHLAGTDVPRASLRDGQGREVWQANGRGPAPRLTPGWAGAVSARLRELGSRASLLGTPLTILINHPPEVDVIFARCGRLPMECAPAGRGRTTAGPIAIPPESLAYSDRTGRARSLELNVGLQHREDTARVALKVPILGSGAARLRGDAWMPLGGGEELDRGEGDAELFRVVPPLTWEGQPVGFGEWAIVEGNTWIGRPRQTPCPLPGLSGLGAALTVRRGPYNSTGDAMSLARAVVDRGPIRAVHVEDVSERRTRLRIELARPLEIDTACRVAVWCCDGRLVWGEPEASAGEGGKRAEWWTAEIPACGATPRAVAVAYDGSRRGLWWADGWSDGLEQLGEHQARGLAIRMRWLRLPILGRESLGVIRYFAQAFATEVLDAWALSCDPPEPLRWARSDEGFLAAVRTVFRDWKPGPETFPALIAREAADRTPAEIPIPEVRLALKMLDLSPVLMAKLLRSWLVDGGVWQHEVASARAILGFLRQRILERIDVGQRMVGTGTALDEVRERCADLLGGVAVGFLESLLDEAVAHIHQGEPLRGVTADNLDVAIGKVPVFRDLLALVILQGFDLRVARRSVALTRAR